MRPILTKLTKPALALTLLASPFVAFSEPATAAVPTIVFPIDLADADQYRYTDTWGAPRSGGRKHLGVDLLGPKMTRLVAAEAGEITWGGFDNGDGNWLSITGDSGNRYRYIHMNNDTPGTDDASASCSQVFSSKICSALGNQYGTPRGIRVAAGEFLGFNGDSGNAESTTPHLHFEIALPDGSGGFTPINPFHAVEAARSGSTAAQELVSKLNSTSSQQAQVIRLYKAFFNRNPDQKGLDYWVGQMNSGASLETLAQSFSQGQEFSKRFGELTDAEYVEFLYTQVLKRDFDSKGKAYWTQQLSSGKVNHSNIVVFFSEGEELITKSQPRVEATLAWLHYKGELPTTFQTQVWAQLRASLTISETLEHLFS